MTKQIDVDTLREWLDSGRPVTVVDIRSGEDRAQWAIPGSIHVPFEALRAGSRGLLNGVAANRGEPVVAVCNAGRTSQVAADLLAGRGFDARSLSGGMKAWSLAWNAADVPLTDPTVRVVQVRRTGKGCLSYIFGSEGEAAVVDPSVAPDVYMNVAAERRWRIRHVIETHIHADHLSRARPLAERTEAQLVLPTQQRVTFAYSPIADGESISIGTAKLTALSTPGHTNESTSYLLNDVAVFTGDTLFTASVGRPDLLADTDHARQRAGRLHASLGRLAVLPADMLVLPSHTSEPIAFDRRAIAASIADIRPWLSDWLTSETAFIERVTSRLPPTPLNFARIVQLNEHGELPREDPAELEAGANRCAVR